MRRETTQWHMPKGRRRFIPGISLPRGITVSLPIAQEFPLPADLETSSDFTQKAPERTVARFSHAQIRKLKSPAATCHPDANRWYSRGPKFLRQNQQKLRRALIPHLLNFTGCRGTVWLKQYVSGPLSSGHCHARLCFRPRLPRPPSRSLRTKSLSKLRAFPLPREIPQPAHERTLDRCAGPVGQRMD